jgi:hypothetical protein
MKNAKIKSKELPQKERRDEEQVQYDGLDVGNAIAETIYV